MPIRFDISEFNYNEVFIETGTYRGDGCIRAVRADFRRIFSIEINYDFYIKAVGRLIIYPQVTIIHGNSIKVLPIILKNINEPVVFWLDAHISGSSTPESCSLYQELEIISKHKIKNHIIMIDDLRCFDGKYRGHQGRWGVNVKLSEVYDRLLSINSAYKFERRSGANEQDILVALP